MNKFLLLLGPSGVGKTTLIHRLQETDARFTYISPYMTRPLRPGEQDKISISDEQMDIMWENNKFIAVNTKFGIRYGTPKAPITEALDEGKYPVLDWPIEHIHIMNQHFPDRLVRIYVAPPSLDELKNRLQQDTRDLQGVRMDAAIMEVKRFQTGQFDGLFDMAFVHGNNETTRVAEEIFTHYRLAIGEGLPPRQERRG